MVGLSGIMEEWTLERLRAQSDAYIGVGQDELRAKLYLLLEHAVPAAGTRRLCLCGLQDDTLPRLFAVLRILSDEAPYRGSLRNLPNTAIGLAICSGNLRVCRDVALPGMIPNLCRHVHFIHLRCVPSENRIWFDGLIGTNHIDGISETVENVVPVLEEQTRPPQAQRMDAPPAMQRHQAQRLPVDQKRHWAVGYPAIRRKSGLTQWRGSALALAS